MASQTAGAKKSPVNLGLIAVLGILIIVGVWMAIASRKQSTDPTITAAPPIVATPGHPIVILRKSPEAMAEQMKQVGMPAPSGTSGQQAAKQ